MYWNTIKRWKKKNIHTQIAYTQRKLCKLSSYLPLNHSPFFIIHSRWYFIFVWLLLSVCLYVNQIVFSLFAGGFISLFPLKEPPPLPLPINANQTGQKKKQLENILLKKHKYTYSVCFTTRQVENILCVWKTFSGSFRKFHNF